MSQKPKIERLGVGAFIEAPDLTGEEYWLRCDPDELEWSELDSIHPMAKIILCLRSLPYPEYLRTEHWDGIRHRAFQRYRGQCLCAKDARDAHHVTYVRKGFERPEDVAALCQDCHRTWHETWRLQIREGLK